MGTAVWSILFRIVDGDIFDQVSTHVQDSTHPGKFFLGTSVIAKSLQYFLLIDVCLVPLQKNIAKVVFSASAEIKI